MSEVVITAENFQAQVLQSEKPVLIDFWATWCGPCMMLGPIVAEIAREHPELKVCKVNVDEQPALASAFGVSSIPMIAVIKDGKLTAKTVGYQPKEQLLALLEK
ncbi:MAG: thioredoxin [Eggerthellales bacterium]|nr:thioredoxin [Eggerthellales bacterium]